LTASPSAGCGDPPPFLWCEPAHIFWTASVIVVTVARLAIDFVI